MELFSIIGVLILIFIVLSVEKILTHGIKFLFYSLLAVFVVVFVFGISLNDIFETVSNLILLVF